MFELTAGERLTLTDLASAAEGEAFSSQGARPSRSSLAGCLHACEAEGWEALRQSHAIGARLSFGWVCSSVLSVHVAWLEKQRMYESAAYLLQALLRARPRGRSVLSWPSR